MTLKVLCMAISPSGRDSVSAHNPPDSSKNQAAPPHNPPRTAEPCAPREKSAESSGCLALRSCKMNINGCAAPAQSASDQHCCLRELQETKSCTAAGQINSLISARLHVSFCTQDGIFFIFFIFLAKAGHQNVLRTFCSVQKRLMILQKRRVFFIGCHS